MWVELREGHVDPLIVTTWSALEQSSKTNLARHTVFCQGSGSGLQVGGQMYSVVTKYHVLVCTLDLCISIPFQGRREEVIGPCSKKTCQWSGWFCYVKAGSFVHLPRVIQLLQVLPPVLRRKILLFEPIPPVHAVPPMPRPDTIPVWHRRPLVQRLPAYTLPLAFLAYEMSGRIIPSLSLAQLLVHLHVICGPRHRHELCVRQLHLSLLARRPLHVSLLSLSLGRRFRRILFRLFARFGPFHGHVDDPPTRVPIDGLLAAAAVLVAIPKEAFPLFGLCPLELRSYFAGRLQTGVSA